MKSKNILIGLAFLLLIPQVSTGGNDNETKYNPEIGNWLMYFGQARLHDKWSIHSEVQFRSHTIFPNTEQWLLRTGLNYHINSSAFATAGYGYITNHHENEEIKGAQTTEHRVWQQFIMRNGVGRFIFEHRYRLEQRWLAGNKSDYLDRVRYFLRVSVPLNNKKIEPKTVFLSFYDEVFLHLTSNPFDRNRLYGAIGYQFNQGVSAQTGYLLQTVGNVSKSHLQFALFLNLDFRDTEIDQ